MPLESQAHNGADLSDREGMDVSVRDTPVPRRRRGVREAVARVGPRGARPTAGARTRAQLALHAVVQQLLYLLLAARKIDLTFASIRALYSTRVRVYILYFYTLD